MGFINTYTLKQYKECYSDLLERHKLEYEDHNEFTFINSELESFWDGFINIEDIEELPFQFQFQKSFTDEELINALTDQKEFRDSAIKSNLSSSLIIDFLEQRKQELENESRTVPDLLIGAESFQFKNNPDKLLRNPDATIFKDDFAFTLFEAMKGIYRDTKTPQADYSFLYDIMKKDGFVVCSGVDFIVLLSNYDINITKIDSARTGNKQKTTLYNSIKESLQKSTV